MACSLREANNEPDGTIMNHPAMDYFRKLWPPDLLDLQGMEASILSPQAKFCLYGRDQLPGCVCRDMDRMQAYFNKGKSHEMTLRGQVMNVLEYIQELDGRIRRSRPCAMRMISCISRGASARWTALRRLLHPRTHNGIAWNMSFGNPTTLKQVVARLPRRGYQISLHAIGDAAVDMALDSIEAAMNANPRSDPRHRIEHSILNTGRSPEPHQGPGCGDLVQPQMIRAFGDGLEKIWGSERMQRMIRPAPGSNMGVPLCLGSDAPSMRGGIHKQRWRRVRSASR